MNTSAKIEGLLFYYGESVEKKTLIELLGLSEESFSEAISELKQALAHRGLSTIETDTHIGLFTSREVSEIIEKIQKEERSKELTKASLETLALVAYSDGITRSDIDYIRGVNSGFILKTLLLRGLVMKVTHPTDTRKFIYKPTTDLFAFLGILEKESLPEWEQFNLEFTERQITKDNTL